MQVRYLSRFPVGLRDPLLKSYQEIVSNYAEHRWEPSELNGGKFCEVVYNILEGYIMGNYPLHPSKPVNMLLACQALEKQTTNPTRTGDRSVRVMIPRLLPVLYEIRNNRGVGHVGGDVDPNFMDANAVLNMSAWVLAELVRIFHNLAPTEAQEIVTTLVERKHPLVWEVDNLRRVLDSNMSIGNQVLLLLHTKPGWITEVHVFKWVEYSSLPMFRKRILVPFHQKRWIEFDKVNGRLRISPTGVKKVETEILKAIAI